MKFELTEFAYPKKRKYCVLDLDSGYIKLSTCEKFSLFIDLAPCLFEKK